ncbi:MAG TPA: DUF4307 domain-containing protein [Motilibacterales bacterium]|nr:DUF4307 domain-containing protein [Motilibacterales bacterium]
MSPARTAGHPSQWPPHIRERYGVTDRPRWAPIVVGVLGLAFLALVTFLGLRLSNPAIDAGVLSYETVSDERMTIGYEVQRREPTPATCVLRARARDGFDVGYVVVELPPAQGRTTHTLEMRTAYRALVGELVGCGITGPPPGIPGAQFRPGVVAPVQPWTPSEP